MILEGLVSTRQPDGTPRLRPMGPEIPDDEPDPARPARFLLKPYRDSATHALLKRTGVGVLHVADDVLTLARATLGTLDHASLKWRPADRVEGWIWLDACRYLEFRVLDCDESEPRARFLVETVASGVLREFFGFHRARHAVLEAAILATRVRLLPAEHLLAEFDRLRVPVEKTAGPREREAFRILEDAVRAALDQPPATAPGANPP